jgi:hypothetical protein
MQREDTYRVTVSVDGRDLGVWDTMSGGAIDSEETTYRPGGLQDQITLGGQRTVSNVTVAKLYRDDVHNLYHWLAQRAGRGAMIVTRQPLDPEGAVFGRPVVYDGKLKSVSLPDVDSTGSGAARLSLEMTCNGSVS